MPSSFANTDSLNLIGQTGIAKRGTGLIPSFDVKANSNAGLEHKEISKRGLSSNEDPTCVGFGTFLALVFGPLFRLSIHLSQIRANPLDRGPDGLVIRQVDPKHVRWLFHIGRGPGNSQHMCKAD